MLCALRPTFIIAGKAKFRLEAGENKDEIKTERNHPLSLSALRHRCRAPALHPVSGIQHDGAAPRRPLARFVTDLEPGGDVNTHLSRL